MYRLKGSLRYNRDPMLCPDQRLAKRAALPQHLGLGVTLPGMRELLKQLPSDAVKQVNLHNTKYPPNNRNGGRLLEV